MKNEGTPFGVLLSLGISGSFVLGYLLSLSSGICNPRIVGLWIYNPRGSQTRSYPPVDPEIHRDREKMRALRREVPSSFRNQTSQI